MTQVTVGHDHTCALKSDGTVWCWGYNGNGELGDGKNRRSVNSPNRQAQHFAGPQSKVEREQQRQRSLVAVLGLTK